VPANVKKIVEVLKAIIDVMYAAPCSNRLFNVALRRKCLPNPGSVNDGDYVGGRKVKTSWQS